MSDTTPRAPIELTVQAELDGWPLDLHLSLPAEKVRPALAHLADLGYAPRRSAPTQPQARPARPKVEPRYNVQGAPCCPVHGRELAEGRYGLYCSAKAAPGEESNDKGYCALRFDT